MVLFCFFVMFLDVISSTFLTNYYQYLAAWKSNIVDLINCKLVLNVINVDCTVYSCMLLMQLDVR